MSRGTRDLLSQRHGSGHAPPGGVVKVGSDPRGAPPPRRTSNGMLLDHPSPSSVGNPSASSTANNTTATSSYRAPASLQHQSAGMTGGGGKDEVALLAELSTKVTAQKRELDNRTDNVNAIQRNFSRLSEMYQSDRARLDELEQKYAEALEELESLRSEKKLYTALQFEFRAIQERENTVGKENQEMIEALKKDLVQTRNKLQHSEEERKHLQKTLTEVGKRIQEDDALIGRMQSATGGTEIAVNSVMKKAFNLQKAFAEMVTIAAPNSSTGKFSTFKDGGEGISYLSSSATGGNAPQQRDQFAVDTRLVAVSSSLMQFCESGLTFFERCMKNIIAGMTAEQQGKEADFKKELDELQDFLQQRDRKILEMEESHSALKNEMKQSVRTYEAELAQLKRYKADADAAGNQSTALQAASEGERRKLLQQITALQSSNDDLTSSKEKLEEESSSLKTQLHSLKQEHSHSSAQIVQLTHSNQALTLEKEQIETEICDLRDQIKRLTGAAEIQEQERQRREKGWNTERQNLLQQIESMSSNSKNADAQVKMQLAELQRQNEELNERVQRSEQHEAEMENEKKKLIEQLTFANSSVIKLNEQVERLTSELTQSREKLAYYSGNQDSVADSLKDKEADLENMRKELKDTMGQIFTLRAELVGKQKEAEAKDTDMETLRKKIQEYEWLVKDAKRYQQESSDLRSSLLTSQESNQRLEQRMKDLQAAKDRAERASEEAVRKAASLMDLQQEFEQQRKALEEKNAQAALRAQQLRVVEEQCAKTVKKVLAAEEACESGYSCQSCFNLFKNPVICAPCGHSYCLDCFDSNSRRNPPPPTKPGKEPVLHCPECDRFVVTAVIESRSLNMLSGKFEYKKQQLSDLAALLDKELAKGGGGGGASGSRTPTPPSSTQQQQQGNSYIS